MRAFIAKKVLKIAPKGFCDQLALLACFERLKSYDSTIFKKLHLKKKKALQTGKHSRLIHEYIHVMNVLKL